MRRPKAPAQSCHLLRDMAVICCGRAGCSLDCRADSRMALTRTHRGLRLPRPWRRFLPHRAGSVAGAFSGMYENDEKKLAKTLAELERLRAFLRDLDAQAEAVEIERQLTTDQKPAAGVCVIDEYERLRRRERRLVVELNFIHARLAEVEKQLPLDYTFSSDSPLGNQFPSFAEIPKSWFGILGS